MPFVIGARVWSCPFQKLCTAAWNCSVFMKINPQWRIRLLSFQQASLLNLREYTHYCQTHERSFLCPNGSISGIACVIIRCLSAPCVACFIPSFGFPLSPHLLQTLVPSPPPYQNPFSLAVSLYSVPLSQLTSADQPLEHSAKKPFFLTQ